MNYLKNMNQNNNDWQKKQNRGKIAFGLITVLAGVLYLLHQLDYGIPGYIFRWPSILIGIAIISFIKNGFKDFFWMLLSLFIGLIFMFNYAYPDVEIFKYKVALILILIGLAIAFIPKKKKNHFHWNSKNNCGTDPHQITQEKVSAEDSIYFNNLFSGTEKTVISKSFKGGEISNTFGGCEVNFLHADINGEATIYIHQQFGGIKLMVPANWTIKSEINCVFAGIEDKRPSSNVLDNEKTLILKGSIFMSGIEIVAY